MNLGLSVHISAKVSLRDVLEYVKLRNLDYLEIKLDRAELIQKIADKRSITDLKDLLSSYDLSYALHAPYIDVNLASLNPDIGKASERTVERSVRLAGVIGARVVTIHPGRLSRDYPADMLPRAVELAVERITNLIEISEDYGVILSLENDHKSYNRSIAAHPDQIRYLIERTDCSFTYDVGHANTVTNPLNFIRILFDNIVNVHLHDNHGDKDEHLGIGLGNVNFDIILRELLGRGYAGPLILEVHDNAELDGSIDRIKSMLSTMDVKRDQITKSRPRDRQFS